MDDRLGHEHHGLPVVSQRYFRNLYGAHAEAYVPEHPDLARIRISRGPGGAFSRLPCGCIGIHDPQHIKARTRADFEDTMSDTTPAESKHLQLLRSLLLAARNGEDVDPRDVVVAREAIELERLRTEGAAERDAQAERVAEAARIKEVCGVLNEQLEAQGTIVQEAHTAALKALEDLCTAVDGQNGLLAVAAEQAGVGVKTERYTTHATIGGVRHETWTPQTYLLNLLHALPRWPLGRGTVFRVELPPAIPGGPRP